MIKIKLARVGKKHQPIYQIVITESRGKITGRKIQVIGSYNPNFQPPKVNLDSNLFLDWLKKGAQPTETVTKLVKPFLKKIKVNKSK